MRALIKNGLIVDGTGAMPYYADLAISGDSIEMIGRNFQEQHFNMIIDAKGMIVTPGLIDGHTHSELNLMNNRQHPNALYQGISTIITGQCGLGFAPMDHEILEESIKFNAGIFGNYYKNLSVWNTFDEYLECLDGCAVNAGANVSHNAIRQAALKFDDKPLIGETLDIAKEVLTNAMKAGATGLSVGLSYYPGAYSDTQELIELCRIVKKFDGILCVHLRLNDHQVPYTPVEEIVHVVSETDVRLNMLHYRTGKMDQDVSDMYAPFRALEESGHEIHYEYYPYMVGAGLLMAWIPGWVQEGGYNAVMQRLQDKSLREKILEEMQERIQYFLDPGQGARIILTEDPYSELIGKTIEEVAEERNVSWNEAVIEVLLENHLQVGYEGVENQSTELKQKLYDDQYKLFTDERYTVGSDTIPAGIMVHPRAFGAFARVIRQMRERNVPVEYTIKKLTSYPASIYHLKNRGILQAGYKADVAVMNYDAVTDQATWDEPRNGAIGVDTLFVNGLPALRHGHITGILGGHVLRRSI